MILILGGKGFVGSAFVRHCERNGIEHAVVCRESYEAMRGTRCEVLVNANGNSSKVRAQRDPLWDFEASVSSVRRTLEDFPTDLYIYLSSCDVYPTCASPLLTREDQPLDIAKQSSYGFHKYLAELCVRQRAKRWLIVRMGGLLGPGLKKNAIFDILGRAPLWLDLDSRLQFLSTGDAARIVMELAERDSSSDVVNVCGRGVVRLGAVIEWVGAAVTVNPGSPRVTYEVSIEKLSKITEVPDTIETVRTFVGDHQDL